MHELIMQTGTSNWTPEHLRAFECVAEEFGYTIEKDTKGLTIHLERTPGSYPEFIARFIFFIDPPDFKPEPITRTK